MVSSHTNATVTLHGLNRALDLYEILFLFIFFLLFELVWADRKDVFRWRYCSLRRREIWGWKEEKVGQFSRDPSDPAHRSQISLQLEEVSGDAIMDGD